MKKQFTWFMVGMLAMLMIAAVPVTKILYTKSILIHSNGSDLTEENGGLPVNMQDQTSEMIDAYFLKSVSNFTISQIPTVSTDTVLSYDFEATAGHGIVTGNEIILLDVASDVIMSAVVTNVVTNTITLDRPIDHAFAIATTLGRIVSSNMAVDGSVTPQVFTFRAGVVPYDIVRILLTITDQTAMDDSKFGGITALTNGLVFRIYDGSKKTIFNFKTNQDIKQFCFDVEYSDKAPAGFYGLSSLITFGGQSQHGVVLRIQDSDVLQFIVQDDLTGLDTLRVAAEGHVVTD